MGPTGREVLRLRIVWESDYGFCQPTTDADWRELVERAALPACGEVLQQTLNIARVHRCRTVVVERAYIDKDYRDEYSHLYAKQFKPLSSVSERLHFFRGTISSLDDLQQQTDKDIGYIGYVVLRPTAPAPTGRTVLRPPVLNRNKDYHLCTSEWPTHIRGRRLVAVGTPFLEQDGMVMRCAQAAIWIVTRTMSSLHPEFSEALPYDITESATRGIAGFVFGRPMPSEGLTPDHMCHALHNLGYAPILLFKEVFDHEAQANETQPDGDGGRAQWDPLNLIYKYVESGVPVLATVPGHAITIVGHTFTHSPVSDSLPRGGVASSSLWVDAFIVHDDAAGPYRILPVSEEYRDRLAKTPRAERFPPEDTSPVPWYRTVQDIDSVIVPLPEKVFLTGEHVDEIVNAVLDDDELVLSWLGDSATGGFQGSGEILAARAHTPPGPVVVRTYFTASTEYKKRLRTTRGPDSLSATVRELYLGMPMSRFIWVSEITTAHRLSKRTESQRTVLGEVILDATSHPRGVTYLAIHLPGLVYVRDVATEAWSTVPVSDERPYRHHSRQL